MKLGIAATFVWLAAAAAMAAEPGFKFFEPLQPPRTFAVMAQRGLAQAAPENGWRAIEMCIEDSLDWVAVDVRRTKDGRHVLFADATLDAKTDGTGPLTDHTLAELQKLDAGSWFAPRFAAARLLALDECLQLAKGKINLALNCLDVDPAALASEIKAASVESQVIVRGDEQMLKRVRDVAHDDIAIMPHDLPQDRWNAEGRPTADFAQWLARLHPAAVELPASELGADDCRRFHALGIQVSANSLGDDDGPATWDRALAAGVDFLLTDVPEELVAHVLDRKLQPRPVRFACHRGASRYAPENTLPAFEKAARLHADFVEFDVRPSKDGEYFLLHDGRLDRTTTLAGPIRDATSQAIEAADAGSWFGRPYVGTHIPALEQFLAAVPEGVSLYFDAKDIPPEALAQAIARHGLSDRTVVYQGAGYLAKLNGIDPRIRAMPPAGSLAQIDRLAASLKPYAVDTPWRVLSAEYIEHCHAAGIQVFSDAPGSVDVEGYRQAIEWGIDLIQTDYPLRAWRAMELTAAGRAEH